MTDKQLAMLRARMDRIGRDKLIDRLENQMINKQMQDDEAGAGRVAEQIEYVRRQTGWAGDYR